MVWDDRDSENGEMRDYKLLYFLQDDTVAIKVIFFCIELRSYLSEIRFSTVFFKFRWHAHDML